MNPDSVWPESLRQKIVKKSRARDASRNTENLKQGNSGASATSAASGHRWTFLTNHAHVLILLHQNPETVLRQVALQVGITERAVQRIIQDLVDDGFVRREKVGRRNKYEVIVDQPLRHPIESHKNIGDLLNLVSQQ